MTIKTDAAEEIHRNPITVAATVVGVVVSALTLFVAWLQLKAAQAAAAPATITAHASLTSQTTANVFLAVASFLASALAAASILRLIVRSSAFSAILLSLPITALSIFSVLLTMRLAPPKAASAAASSATVDAALYGTLIVVVAVNAAPLARKLLSREASQQPEQSAQDAEGEGGLTIGVLIFMVAIWGALVRGAVGLLQTAFLA